MTKKITGTIEFDLNNEKSILEKKWYEQWLYVGHVDEISQCGDFFTLQVIDYPIIILRNEDGIICFNNSCRHRGSRVCQKERGNNPNLVCPYHQWTYDLKGQLKYAHSMMDEINCKDYQLVQYPVSIENNHIFINLTKDNLLLKNSGTIEDELSSTSNLVLEGKIDNIAISDDCLNTHVNYIISSKLGKNVESQTALSVNCYLLMFSDFDLTISKNPTSRNSLQLTIKFLSKYGSVSEKRVKTIFKLLKIDYKTVNVFNPDKFITLKEKLKENKKIINVIANFKEKPIQLVEAKKTQQIFGKVKTWSSDNNKLVCTMVIDESHNVKTYTFQAETPCLFNYKPGQFITLQLPTDTEEPTLRTYTLSSSPSRPLSISITIKAQIDSFGTHWIFENVTPGTVLKAYGPAGNFSFFEKPTEKYLFISAGSGITPMLSMTRWMFDHGSNMDINFISCVQKPEDLLFDTELRNIANRSKDIRVTWVCEEDPDNRWTGYRGRFNKLILGLSANDYIERDVYCCGPEPFMIAVRNALIDTGYNMDNYFQESFSNVESNDNIDFTSTLTEEITNISFIKSKKIIKSSQQETLLQAAKRSSIVIPSACGFGVCGTCKVKVKSGKTHMVHSGGISESEINNGYVLACCTRPIDDVKLSL